MKKVLIIAGVALLLFVLVTQPESAAGWVRGILGGLRYGAEALITFVGGIFRR
ncbi:MAG: hypothetical protein JOZ47_11770 [Kutzneria sp.]|nr:hypothetical protein [Kutzneria sp.]MBV9845738.1 hypothetical protein [Kutzneria sp.]